MAIKHDKSYSRLIAININKLCPAARKTAGGLGMPWKCLSWFKLPCRQVLGIHHGNLPKNHGRIPKDRLRIQPEIWLVVVLFQYIITIIYGIYQWLIMVNN